MFLAVRFAPLGTELLSFKITLACGAVEALGVEVLVHGLHPPVAGLNGELTCSAHGLEHDCPTLFTVELLILNVELGPPDGFSALCAQEALRAEAFLHGIHALPDNRLVTLVAVRGKVLRVVVLAVEEALLLHKAHVEQLTTARGVGANEATGAPALAHCSHKWPSDGAVAARAHRNAASIGQRRWVHRGFPLLTSGGTHPRGFGGRARRGRGRSGGKLTRGWGCRGRGVA